MRARAALVGLALLAGLAACSNHDDTGGVSADDQRALNDAAAMLDANTAVPAQPSDQGNSQ
ncbi:MAG TPA: hypothetical protein VN137_03715 [Sphingomonas sp.]|nr:hypothetical protein [Sphingomonas sp.]